MRRGCWDDKNVNIFDQYLNRPIAQVYPVKGECEFPQMSCLLSAHGPL